jgi:hypothetical protein
LFQFVLVLFVFIVWANEVGDEIPLEARPSGLATHQLMIPPFIISSESARSPLAE